jgi:hypothetical protein
MAKPPINQEFTVQSTCEVLDNIDGEMEVMKNGKTRNG